MNHVILYWWTKDTQVFSFFFFFFFFKKSSSKNWNFYFYFSHWNENVGTDCCVLLRWPIQTASRRRRRSQISPVMNKELLGYLSFSSFSFILNVQVTVTEKKLTVSLGLSRSIFSTKEKTVSAQKGQNFQGEIFYNVQFAIRTRREEFCPSGQ